MDKIIEMLKEIIALLEQHNCEYPEDPPVVEEPRLFSEDSFWNKPLAENTPIHPDSDAKIADIVRQVASYTSWINTDVYSTPFYVVNGSKVPKVDFISTAPYGPEFQKRIQDVPLPYGFFPAAGSDAHAVIWDLESDTMWEFWQVELNEDGQWTARWGARIDNVSTSDGVVAPQNDELHGATATSLPMIGGTILLEEAREGIIPHALALSLVESEGHVAPALRSDGSYWANVTPEDGKIPEGATLRLPANYVIETENPFLAALLTAARDHGLIIRDKAGAVVLYGEAPIGDDDQSDWEAIYGGALWSLMRDFPWGDLQVVDY